MIKRVRDAPLPLGQQVYLRDYGARGRHKIRDLWGPVVHQVVRAFSGDGAVHTVAPVSDLNKTRNVHRDMLKAVVPAHSTDCPPLASPSPSLPPQVAPADDSSGSELWFLVTENVASPLGPSQPPAAPLVTLAPDRPSTAMSRDQNGTLPQTSSLSPSDQPSTRQQALHQTACSTAGCHPNVHRLPRPAGRLEQAASRPQNPVSNSQLAMFRPWR